MSEKFGVINDAGTFVEVMAEQFAPFKSAGYRRVKQGEAIPPQAFEYADSGAPPAAPDAAALKRVRKATPPAQPDEPTE